MTGSGQTTESTQVRHGKSQEQETSTRGPPGGLSVQSKGGWEVSHGPASADLSRAATPNLQGDARMEPVKNDFGRGNVAFARNGFAERAQNGQRVGVRSPIGAPDDWRIGDVLAKEGGQMGAIALKLGRTLDCVQSVPASRACGEQMDTSSAVQAFAQGRGEDVCGSQIGAGDEAGDLHLGSVITLVRSLVQKGSNGIVTTSGLT